MGWPDQKVAPSVIHVKTAHTVVRTSVSEAESLRQPDNITGTDPRTQPVRTACYYMHYMHYMHPFAACTMHHPASCLITLNNPASCQDASSGHRPAHLASQCLPAQACPVAARRKYCRCRYNCIDSRTESSRAVTPARPEVGPTRPV